MVNKQRTQQHGSFSAVVRTDGIPRVGNNVLHRYACEGQAISSDGNPYHLLGKVRGDVGGPFTSTKVEVQGLNLQPWLAVRLSSTPGKPPLYETRTLLCPSPVVASLIRRLGEAETGSQILSALGSPPSYSVLELNALGTRAVSSMSPLNPAADVATQIAEFASERKFFSVPGNAGSAPGEYLNYQFGIAPTVGFAKELREAIRNKEKIVSQLARDSGRWVRRRGMIFSDSSNEAMQETQADVSTVGPAFVSTLAARGKLYTTVHVSRRAWFSGAFTYHVPREGIMRTVAELDKKYGVKPGASTAWELLPYSWLVDYKFNIGQILNNLDQFASDGLVMPYGYVMGQQVRTTHYRWEGQIRDNTGSFRPTVVVADVVETSKQRVPANPFGFGISPGDLTTRQLSILAALGLSKAT